MEEGRRSKGKNSLWDSVRNKDYVACTLSFLMMLLGVRHTVFLEGEMWAELGPLYLADLVANPRQGPCLDEPHVFSSDGQMMGLWSRCP